MTQAALDDLVRLLDLEAIEVNTFRGTSPRVGQQRVFGGQVAGQALVAAGRTVPGDRRVHSLHAYFLRPGDPTIPILYEVDRIRDGRSFTTRRVVAIQHGRAIFNLSASFHADEPGFDHQTPMPAVPPPDSLPTFHERLAPYREQVREWYERPRPIDMRFAVPGATLPRVGLGNRRALREPDQHDLLARDAALVLAPDQRLDLRLRLTNVALRLAHASEVEREDVVPGSHHEPVVDRGGRCRDAGPDGQIFRAKRL